MIYPSSPALSNQSQQATHDRKVYTGMKKACGMAFLYLGKTFDIWYHLGR